MNTQRHYVRVGLFIAIGVALGGIVVLVYGGARLWSHRDRYTIDIAGTVLGLQRGGTVYFDGVEVGSVDSIALAPRDPAHVRIVIAVESGTPIRVDTRAVVVVSGLTGVKVVDLRETTAPSPILPPGSTIAVGESDLDRAQRKALHLVDRSTQLVDDADRVVARVANGGELDAIIRDTRAAAASLAATTEELHGLLATNRAGVTRVLASFDRIEHAASKLLAGPVDDLVGNANHLVAELRASALAALAELRRATSDLKELVRDLRADPSRLIRSRPLPDRRVR